MRWWGDGREGNDPLSGRSGDIETAARSSTDPGAIRAGLGGAKFELCNVLLHQWEEHIKPTMKTCSFLVRV